MKIAFVSTILGYPWGGADTLWTKAAESAAEHGHELLLALSPLTRAHPRVAALEGRGARVQERAPRQPGSLAARAWRKLRRPPDPLVSALRAFEPDLVVISCGGAYDLIAEPELERWLRSERIRFRIIANYQVEHPVLALPDLALAREVFARADRLFFVSNRNLACTRRHLLRPLPNARVLHNPLRCGPCSALPYPTGPFRLATISRLEAGKGIDLALHALAAALGHEPDWELDIFGRGPLEGYLRDTVEAVGLQHRVHLRGYVSDLAEIWRERHAFLSASIEDGVPMTIPEAMLHGRPVISTAVGGAEDWLRDGHSGFLCAAPTLPLLADTLRLAWSQRANWSQLGRNAASDAKSNYRPHDFQEVIAR